MQAGGHALLLASFLRVDARPCLLADALPQRLRGDERRVGHLVRLASMPCLRRLLHRAGYSSEVAVEHDIASK
jgi:hypothetical protein